MATDALRAELILEAGKAIQEMKAVFSRLENDAGSAGKSAGKSIVNGIENQAQSLKLGDIIKANLISGFALNAIQGAVSGLFSQLSTGIKAGMNFESELSNIKALTGSTGSEMTKISNLSLQLGKDTKFSALESAQGISELLKAGVSLEQVFAGGASGALSLAAAGEISVKEAAEIASTALNTFSKDGLNVGKAADILAGGANASATSISELKFGLSAVGTVASGIGLSFKDTTTALSLFAQNGLKGSDAGTSLKTMLMNLQPQTKAQTSLFQKLGLMTQDGSNQFFTAEGKIKSFAEISGVLKNALKNQTDQQKQTTLETLFGADAIRAGNILVKEGAEGFNKMSAEMGKFTAADVAKERMNNLKGSMDNFNSTIETVSIKITSLLLPIFKAMVDVATNAINYLDDAFTKADPKILIAGAIGLGTVLTGVLAPALMTGATALYALISPFIVANAPIVAFGIAVAGVAYLIQSNWDSIAPIFDNAMSVITNFATLGGKAFDNLKNSFNGGSQNSEGIQNLLKGIGLSPELSTKIAGASTAVASNLKLAWSDITTAFSGGTTGGSGINNILKGIGLDAGVSNQITARILEIGANIKTAFAELGSSLTGQSNSGFSIAKVLGISPEEGAKISGMIAGISTSIQLGIAGIPTMFAQIGTTISSIFNNPLVQAGIQSIITALTTQLLPALTNLWTTVSSLLLPILNQVFNFLGVVLPPILTAVGAIIGAVLVVAINVAIQAFSSLVNGINIAVNIFTIVSSVVTAVFGTIVAYLSAVIQTIIAIFTGNFSSIQGIWLGFLTQLSTLWSNAWTTISTALSNIWTVISTTIMTAWNNLVLFFTAGFLIVQGIWNTFWSGLWNKIVEIWTGILTAITTKWNEIKQAVDDGVNNVGKLFETMKTNIDNVIKGIDLYQAGVNIIQGLINGFNSLLGKITEIANNIKNTITGALSGSSNLSGAKSMSIGNNADGTTNWRGGLTTVAEQGRELIRLPNGSSFIADALSLLNLPRGTEIYSNPQTEKMFNQQFNQALPNLPDMRQTPNFQIPAPTIIEKTVDNSSSQINNYTNSNSNSNRFGFGADLSFNS